MLFVHGFAEHCARYKWTHDAFAVRGVAVFTYDQRGFGRTALDGAYRSKGSAYAKTSWREQLADMEWWLAHVRQAFPGVPVFLMGQSMVSGRACRRCWCCPAGGTGRGRACAKEAV